MHDLLGKNWFQGEKNVGQNLFQDKVNWVIIGRQYMIYWVRIGFRKKQTWSELISG
jgi:hypothetical protein